MTDFDLYAGAAQEYSERHRAPEQPTLRDQFAMAALTGLISVSGRLDSCADVDEAARASYLVADAMLLARAAK